MASENNQGTEPDSWDNDENEDQVNNKPMKNWNLNAPEFIPGQNPYASTFVPSGFGKSLLVYIDRLVITK